MTDDAPTPVSPLQGPQQKKMWQTPELIEVPITSVTDSFVGGPGHDSSYGAS